MKLFLLLIPVLTSLGGFVLYRFQDRKKEIFKLDFVQFIYLFIVAPTMYVWLKSFLFFILRTELDVSLSVTDLFVVDTIFSVIMFLLISVLAIHTLTKTFWLKRQFDPEFDIFHLSEYFHLWWSHIAIWGGAMLLATFLSMSNIFVPLAIEITKAQFYLMLLVGIFGGFLLFYAIWSSDPEQGNYMRLMKILMVVFFIFHVIVYFIADPAFDSSLASFWFIFMAFFAATFSSAFFDRYKHTSRFRQFFLHAAWGNNIKLFEKKKK